MYKLHTDHTRTRTSKLPQDSKKTNKSMSFSTRVISTTSVSRPQLKSNPIGDRVLRSDSRGKKLEVEEHRRNVKLPKNKTSVTACNDSLNAKTLNKTVASESNKKPRNNVRKLYEHFGKIYKWSYIKFTPSGYMWKPKSPTRNVNPNVSLPLDNVSKTANVLKTKTSSPMFDELLNGSSKVVSKSSAVFASDAPNERQQLTTPLNNHITPTPTCQIPSIAPTVISSENINQAEPHAENDQAADDEFINIFSTPV
nr:hypothetical protein [Tanacetum cinerariifolium]